MIASPTMTIRVSPDLKGKLERLARSTRRSNSSLAAEAVAAYVERELEIVEGIERALDDMQAGRTAPHEQAMARLDKVVGA